MTGCALSPGLIAGVLDGMFLGVKFLIIGE